MPDKKWHDPPDGKAHLSVNFPNLDKTNDARQGGNVFLEKIIMRKIVGEDFKLVERMPSCHEGKWWPLCRISNVTYILICLTLFWLLHDSTSAIS